jgi:hypothetical protein
MFNNSPPPPENRAVHEITLKNFVEPDRPGMRALRMPIAMWVPDNINTFSEYVIIIAFVLQQWWHNVSR